MERGHTWVEVSFDLHSIIIVRLAELCWLICSHFFPPPRYNNVDQATNAKIHIEQKQREEAQARKEKNEKWEPRVSHFVKFGKVYIYFIIILVGSY